MTGSADPAAPQGLPARPNDRGSAGFAVLFSGAAVALAVLALVAAVAAVGSTKGGAGVSTSAGAPATVHVIVSEYAFSPSAITMQTGATLHITNSGSQAHNFSIPKAGVKSPDIPAGGAYDLDLSSLAAGTYDVVCLVSGHEQAGMKGTLTVSDDAPAPAAEGDAAAASHEGGDDHDWAKMDEDMAKGMETYLASLAPDAAPLTPGVGNAKLEPTIGADGAKEFRLEAKIADWTVEPGRTVKAWTFNGIVPAPWIRVEPGDKVRVLFVNSLPASSDIHWHGASTPFDQDGVAPLTQPMVKPGGMHTYEFTVPNHPELGMYHPHNHGQIAIPNGMFGVIQVGDVELPRGKTVNGEVIPADLKITQELPMVLNDAGVIGLSLNGKGFPATGATVANVGDAVLIHYYNEGLQAHPMHLHHIYQLVVAKDGVALDAPYYADTVNVAPGERYTVLVRPTQADIGAWAWHCHILTHAESDKGLTGMVTAFVVPDPNAKADA